MNRRTGVALALITAAISGVSVYVNGDAVRRFDDATVYTTAKNLVAAVLLLVPLLFFERLSSHSDANRSKNGRTPWVPLAVIGLVGGAIPFVLFFEGLARASSPSAAFVHKTLVVWVAILAVPLLRERLTWAHVGAIALLVAGQASMVDGLGRLRPGDGELMVLAATLLWAVEVVVAKRVLAGVPSTVVGAARMGIGVVALVGWLAVTGRAGDLAGLSARQWWWALVTGLLLSGYVATWYAALARAQAVDVTAVLVLGAVLTALIDATLDGAPLRPDALPLVLLGVGGTIAAVLGTRRPAPDPAPAWSRRPPRP